MLSSLDTLDRVSCMPSHPTPIASTHPNPKHFHRPAPELLMRTVRRCRLNHLSAAMTFQFMYTSTLNSMSCLCVSTSFISPPPLRIFHCFVYARIIIWYLEDKLR